LSERISGTMPKNNSERALRFAGDLRGIPLSHLVVLLVFPMGLICTLTFYWPIGALGALPVFAAAWLIVGAFCCLMCKSMGRHAIWIPVLVFLLGSVVALGVARENLNRFDNLDTRSDDLLYLQLADKVAAEVRHAPIDIWEAADAIPKINYTGYPVFLGYLFAPLQDSDAVRFAAAVTVNLAAVCLMFFSVVLLASALGPINRSLMLLVIFASLPELLYFSSLVLKDCIVAAMIIGMTVLLDHDRKLRPWKRLMLAGLILVVLWNLRAPFVLIALLSLPLWVAARHKSFERPMVTLLLAALVAVVYSLTGSFLIRTLVGSDFEPAYGAGAFNLVTTGFGYGRKLYEFPVIGPIMFLILSPLPLNPLSMTTPWYFTDVLRSLGSLFSLGLLFAAFRGKLFKLLWQPIFLVSFTIYGLIIYAVALGVPDARYKLSAAPFLALMAYTTSLYLHKLKPISPTSPADLRGVRNERSLGLDEASVSRDSQMHFPPAYEEGAFNCTSEST